MRSSPRFMLLPRASLMSDFEQSRDTAHAVGRHSVVARNSDSRPPTGSGDDPAHEDPRNCRFGNVPDKVAPARLVLLLGVVRAGVPVQVRVWPQARPPAWSRRYRESVEPAVASPITSFATPAGARPARKAGSLCGYEPCWSTRSEAVARIRPRSLATSTRLTTHHPDSPGLVDGVMTAEPTGCFER